MLIGFVERVAIEGLLLHYRRRDPSARDDVHVAVVFGSLIEGAVLIALSIAWVLTGRGPGLRIHKHGLGGPRQRPLR